MYLIQVEEREQQERESPGGGMDGRLGRPPGGGSMRLSVEGAGIFTPVVGWGKSIFKAPSHHLAGTWSWT